MACSANDSDFDWIVQQNENVLFGGYRRGGSYITKLGAEKQNIYLYSTGDKAHLCRIAMELGPDTN